VYVCVCGGEGGGSLSLNSGLLLEWEQKKVLIILLGGASYPIYYIQIGKRNTYGATISY